MNKRKMLKISLYILLIIFTFIVLIKWIRCSHIAFRKVTFFLPITNILYFIFITVVILSVSYYYMLCNIVYCETLDSFFINQHNIRVTIIEDLITQSTAKDNLLAINKCIKAKIALLNPESNFSNDLDFTPLISTPINGWQAFRRLLFWFFCTFICILLDGSITFGSYMLNDPITLQTIVLNNFLRISSDYELVKDLYKVLVSLTIIHD